MGALWCQERDISKLTIKARSFCKKMGQKWRMALDLTYPYTSMMSGFGFNTLLEEVFTDTQIEDLWVPFFTITTDISVSSMRIHEVGSVWRYVRGSMSLGRFIRPFHVISFFSIFFFRFRIKLFNFLVDSKYFKFKRNGQIRDRLNPLRPFLKMFNKGQDFMNCDK